MFNVYENPWGLTGIAVVILFTILVLRTIFPEKRLRWLMVIPALIVVVAFALDYLVETDREKIDAVISTAVKAVQNEDPDAVSTVIANNYRDSYHSSKSALMSHCRTVLSEPIIEKNIKRIVSINIQPPNATVIFTVRTLFDKQSDIYQGFKQQMLTEAQANLRKQPDGRWLIDRIELLKIDLHPAGWKDVGSANW
jgi:hypothetical protein